MSQVKRSLFNKYEAWTDEATEYARAIHAALKPIFTDAAKDGARIRDVEYIIQNEASMIACEMIVREGIEQRKKKQLRQDGEIHKNICKGNGKCSSEECPNSNLHFRYVIATAKEKIRIGLYGDAAELHK